MGSHAKIIKIAPQDDLADIVKEARESLCLGPPAQEQPKGSYSIKQWAKLLGMGESAIKIRMRDAVAQGRFERLIVTSRDCTGRTYTLPVYRKVKGAPNAKLDSI